MKKSQSPIIVIGAGIAGLYSAYLLKAQGFSVKILEASSQYGGRIRSINQWADFPLELGAAFIHGDKQLFYELAQFKKVTLGKVTSKPYYIYKGQLLDSSQAAEKKKLKKAIRFFDRVYQYRGPDIPIDQHLAEKSYFKKTKSILTGFAYEYGTDPENLGIRSLAVDEYNWHSGNDDFVSSLSFTELIHEFYEPLQEDIQLNTIVKEIDYSNSEIKVVDEAGQCYIGSAAIVTVPLSVLKSRMIDFTPPLPAMKSEAIQRIGFDVGLKVFLKFKTTFWPQDMTELYGADHCHRYEDATMGHQSKESILCAYVMGKQALAFGKLTDSELIKLLINELNDIFGSQLASDNFIEGLVHDWGKTPFIWGAYSFASPFSEGMREELAKPLHNRLFFAGEATNFQGHTATVHGAMESAELAAEQLITLNQNIEIETEEQPPS